MKKILLIGANGQLGNDLLDGLTNELQVSIDILTSKDFDFSQTDKVMPFLKGLETPDFVINAMALTDTSLCEEKPELSDAINHYAVKEISKYCKSVEATFIHFSTDYVFDGHSDDAYLEEDITNPINHYGRSKLEAEKSVASILEKYFILRVSSLFGPRDTAGNFVNTILKKIKSETKLTIVNDQFMVPTFTLHVVKIVREIIISDFKKYGIYHCTNKGTCSWYEFTKEIVSLANAEVSIKPVSHTKFPSKLKRPQNSTLNSLKLYQFFDLPNWKEALKECFQVKKDKGYKI